ncbi:ATP-grasp fold amidoligase family protein [Rubneribacter badeniensis]|uniref:ATP-grasp fold amidoligase family protein n=1 Tax=Rubneribacter badeniensis TaxID=2070688 RepID=UPI003A94F81F
MSIKDCVLPLLPKKAELWLRDAVYHRNCRLKPERYRVELERWYRLTTGRDCHLDNPQTLGEKIQWLKLYDSTPQKGLLADKWLVRDWVAKKAGNEYLVPSLGVWSSVHEIDFDALPDKFVLKATHGSGWNIIVEDKSQLDRDAARLKLDHWLSRREAMTGGFELHYEFCEPRIVAEQFMKDDSGALRDYKFITFYGDVQFILAIEGRFTDELSCVYMPDWTKAPFTYGYRVGRPGEIKRPDNLDEMLGLARLLGRDFPFARVDFYEVEGRVYFGEVTFTEANGLSAFAPVDYDLKYGQKLVLPSKKPFKGVML